MHRTIISDETVAMIRSQYADGHTQGWLAKTHGVSIAYIGRIVRGEARMEVEGFRTREEITMLRRNPDYEDQIKRDARASQRRMWEMLHPNEPMPDQLKD